ncbi:MAG TPA: hypothetical protein VIN58_01235 [Roseateles sp.]
MTKIEAIQQLMTTGHVGDLLLMLEGDSPYSDEHSEGAPDDRQLARLWTAALYHLRFVAEFGPSAERQFKQGKWLSAFPAEFSEWLQAGAPGVSMADLERCLRANSGA